MARLIDADKQIAEIKKTYCDGCDNYGGAKCRACWVDDAMCLIDDAPTVDAVEVVRCQDCKWYMPGDLFTDIMFCHRLKRITENRKIQLLRRRFLLLRKTKGR